MTENINKQNKKEKVLTGLFWTFGERILAQGVSFILSVILARILMPEEYGIIAMVMVFINIANVFTNGGLGEALVQKKDSDDIDFSTIFYCTLGISLIIYVLLFLFAPIIADFYHNLQIIWVLRILAIKIVISSVGTIQHAYVSKHMLFKKFFFSTLGGTVISGILGIILAKNGFGVWALVVQYLSNTIIDATVLFFTVPWRPKVVFSKKSAKTLLSFGWKMVIANLVNEVYNDLRSLIIGHKYSSKDLAFYNKGNQIPSLAITNIDVAIGNVIFPAMSSAKDKDELKKIARRSMKTTSYLIFPIMIGLIVVSKSLIYLLLTDKWLSCVKYMQILCVYWMSQPIQTTNWQIIKALGRSDICLKLEILKKVIGIIMVIIAMNIDVMAITISAALFGIISMIINMIPNKKLINYTITEQIKDILPALILSFMMGAIVYCISIINISSYIILFIQIICGILIYVGVSYILKIDSFIYLIDTVKKIFGKRKILNKI